MRTIQPHPPGSPNGPTAKLATTDEVAFFAAALVVGNGFEEPSDDYSRISSCTTNATSFTPDTSTPYTGDGATILYQCPANGGARTSSQRVDKCVDSAQTANSCNASTTRFADGPDGNTTYDFIEKSRNPAKDVSWKVKGDIALSNVDSNSTGPFSTTTNGTVTWVDNLKNFGLVVVFDQMNSSSTSDGQTSSSSLNGTYSVVSTQGNCPIGSVTFKTDMPEIYINNSGSSTNGKYTLTGANGKAATIEINSDDTFLVTLSNGQTKTYPQAALWDAQALCP